MQNCFKPQWREGTSLNTYTGVSQVVETWHVNVHKGRVRMEVLPEFLAGGERDMGPGVQRLQFGSSDGMADVNQPHKGKGKGGGKAGVKPGKDKRTGPSIPLDPSMYRQEDDGVRSKLGNLQFSRYPFSVVLRKMEVNTDTRMDDSTKRRQEQEPHPNKRRSPTPDATYHPSAAQPAAQALDPWAAARSSTSAREDVSATGNLRMGDRISA